MKRIAFLIMILTVPFGVSAQDTAPKDAVQDAESDTRKDADDSRFSNAYELYKLKRFDQALAWLGEYIEVYPDGIHRKEVYRLIGDIYLSRFDYKRAIKYYSMLFEEFGGEEEGIGGYYQTGICYSRMGKTEKAVEIFKAIIDQYPGSSFAQKSRTQLEIEEIVK